MCAKKRDFMDYEQNFTHIGLVFNPVMVDHLGSSPHHR